MSAGRSSDPRPPAAAPAGAARRTAGLGVLQRLGRSLMLPIAALPVAALMLRLGQPDMLGDGDTGLALGARWSWLTPVADVLAAAGGALFENLGLLFAVGVAVGFARKSDGSTALAAVVGYLVFDAVTDAMSPYVLHEGRRRPSTTASSAASSSGSRPPCSGSASTGSGCRPYLAFFGGRRFVPIVTAGAALALGVLLSFAYPAFDTGLTGLGDVAGRQRHPRGRGLRRRQPAADPVRAAPPAQLGALVRGRVLPAARRRDRARRHRAVPVRGPDRRLVHDRVLPDHDVRAAGRGAGDLPGGHPRPPQGGRRRDAVRRAHVVPDRRDRAARVRVHVRRVAALPHPRRAHRYVDGAGQRARHPRRLRVLGRRDRLRAELHRPRRTRSRCCSSGSATRWSTTCSSGSRSAASTWPRRAASATSSRPRASP